MNTAGDRSGLASNVDISSTVSMNTIISSTSYKEQALAIWPILVKNIRAI